VYRFAFAFACERGFKTIDIDSACALMSLFFDSKCKFLDKWCKFLQMKKELKDKNKLNALPRDTWDLFYDLVK